jgi:ligand-binding sensor domain-containing protein
LKRFSSLREAYDVGIFHGKLAVAHRHGITLFDTAAENADTTFCNDIICWSIDVADTLLIGTGVETCALITPDYRVTVIPVPPENNIPWGAVRDRTETIYLATQKGLYRIKPGTTKAECIGFKNKCIKAVYIDKKNHLWVGKYFKPE